MGSIATLCALRVTDVMSLEIRGIIHVRSKVFESVLSASGTTGNSPATIGAFPKISTMVVTPECRAYNHKYVSVYTGKILTISRTVVIEAALVEKLRYLKLEDFGKQKDCVHK